MALYLLTPPHAYRRATACTRITMSSAVAGVALAAGAAAASMASLAGLGGLLEPLEGPAIEVGGISGMDLGIEQFRNGAWNLFQV